jgi:hypothetical protein
MKQRTTNKNHYEFEIYGGRGIKMCREWYDSFAAFGAYVLPLGYRDDLTIDRIDNDGNYEPGNVRWATLFEQSHNKRLIFKSNKSGYRGVYFYKPLGKWRAK